ncbi:MAG: glycosyltransferase [Candidatus Paceibacterota bacterium]
MNSENIKVSILMPVFNAEKYLRKAIDSIILQTEKKWELILVDDGSTDNSIDVVSSYQDDRIKYFKKEHSGIVDTLNFGLSKCSGKYIARMDSDDISKPERLEKQIKFMEDNSFVLSGTFADIIDCLDNITGNIEYLPKENKKIKLFLLFHNPFIHSSVIFNKNIIIKSGGYRDFKHVEDYELWTRIIYKNKIANLPERLICYRVHDKQITKRFNLKMRLNGFLVRIIAVWRFIFRF